MGETVRLQGVETLEIKQGLDHPLAGGVAVRHGEEVGANGDPEGGIARAELEEVLADEIAGKIGMRQARRQTMADRLLQGRMVEDARGHEAAELRLAAHRLLRLEPDPREDGIRIGLVQRPHIASDSHQFPSRMARNFQFSIELRQFR